MLARVDRLVPAQRGRRTGRISGRQMARSQRNLLLGVALALSPATLGAQVESRSATIAVTLRVLPHATFSATAADAELHALDATLAPGQRLTVAPSRGVRTRLVYDAAARIEVRATAPVGPGGVQLEVRYLWSFGDGMNLSAAEPFDSAGRLVPPGTRMASLPIAVGADVSATAASVPPGLYSGRVTLLAVNPVY